MSKFKSVLSDEQIEQLAEKHLFAYAQFIGAGEVTVDGEIAFARELEQAVLGKLHQQDPDWWACTDTDTGRTHLADKKEKDVLARVRRFFVFPLYRHPMLELHQQKAEGEDQAKKDHNWIGEMSKFKRVLSDGERSALINEAHRSNPSRFLDEVIDLAEQTVQAKLYEQQEPVAWMGENEAMLFKNLERAKRLNPDEEWLPLYAHPMPTLEQEPLWWACTDTDTGRVFLKSKSGAESYSRIRRFIVTPLYPHPYVSLMRNETGCVSEGAENETQPSSQGFLDRSNHIPDVEKKGGLELSVDTAEVQALIRSYLDGLEGWQLVPIEPTKEMINRVFNSVSITDGVVRTTYRAMLRAAPKYKDK